MGTEKRERQKAARAARLEEERKAAARQRQIRTVRNVVLMGVGIIVLLFVLGKLTGCSSNDAGVQTRSPSTTTGAPTKASATAAKLDYGSGACPTVSGAKRTIRFTDAPKRCIDPTKTYIATIDTTLGTLTARFDTKRTPITTNNFVALARYGFYDGTDLFRTEANTGIIQGGSPTTQGNRDPGPGYTIPDEGGTFTAKDYAAGALAMARGPAPDSAGGQFFLLANDGAKYLGDPSQPGGGTYVVFGSVIKGSDVLQRIAALDSGDGAGTPTTTPKIKTVTISES